MNPEIKWKWQRRMIEKSLSSMTKKLKVYGDSDILTAQERNSILRAREFLEVVIDGWDGRNNASKRQYLRKESEK